MSEKITKKALTYFLKKYPLTKLFANPSVNVPTLLYIYLLLEEQLEVMQEIRNFMTRKAE